MTSRTWFVLPLSGILFLLFLLSLPAPACCPAGPSGKPVVNADQTVIIIWDPVTKTQHFIRQASFKSKADDFGFLVPTPSQPELNESGNEAFPYLLKVTEPEVKVVKRTGGLACGCASSTVPAAKEDEGKVGPPPVKVLEEKLVAGFKAAVLEARSAEALVGWLKENGYVFSPEVEAWAKPYVDAGWKITALKVAKDQNAKDQQSVAAAALRMTFRTDRPIFPYREPDSRSAAEELLARKRLLRIYFIADVRYQGGLTADAAWTGQVAWANKLSSADRAKVLKLLKLPETTGPERWWLTEFEDPWPYRVAPADVYFARAANQDTVKRPPIIRYVSSPWPTDATAFAIAAVMFVPPLLRRVRNRRQG